MNENVKIALIGGMVSVVVALITSFAQTKATLQNEKPAFIEDARKQLAVSVTGVPVGTVVASMVEPKEFAKLVGDKTNFDTRTSQWVPADGRSVAGSRYASVVTSTAPDLRGIFIRGLNHSEKDRVRKDVYADVIHDRVAGSFQKGATKLPINNFQVSIDPGHTHGDPTWSGQGGPYELAVQNRGPGGSDFGAQSARTTKDGNHGHKITGGDNETRPKNIAMYYYIKIN